MKKILIVLAIVGAFVAFKAPSVEARSRFNFNFNFDCLPYFVAPQPVPIIEEHVYVSPPRCYEEVIQYRGGCGCNYYQRQYVRPAPSPYYSSPAYYYYPY